MSHNKKHIFLGILCVSITALVFGGCSNDNSASQDVPISTCDCETGEHCTDVEKEDCKTAEPACPESCPNDCTNGVCNTHDECPAECPNDCTNGVCNTHDECPAECPDDCTNGVCNTHDECPTECPNDCTNGACNTHDECPAECPDDCDDKGVCNTTPVECPAECPNDCDDKGVCNTTPVECPAECPNNCDDDGVCNTTPIECPTECPNNCDDDGVCNTKPVECPAECKNGCDDKGACKCPTDCKNGCDNKGACKCPADCKNGCDNKGACKCPAECPDKCSAAGVCNNTCKYTTIEKPDIRPMAGEKTGKTEQIPETINGKTYTDYFMYNSSNAFKVGVREDWGGSIVFFGEAGSSSGINYTNTIDGLDPGREVQFAMYDPSRLRQGCAITASCTDSNNGCGTETYYLGWNPVQGGNRCGQGSGVHSIDFENEQLKVVTTPLHWNPAWRRTDCQNSKDQPIGECADPELKQLPSDVQVTQTIRFIQDKVIEIQYTVENQSDISHPVFPVQEMPTLYSAHGEYYGSIKMPDLSVLMTASNQIINIDEVVPNEEGENKGFYKKQFTTSVPWVTLQNNQHDYGVGLLHENGLLKYEAWQSWNPEVHYNNVRAQFPFGLPAKGTVSARAYLLLGAYSDIANTANNLIKTIPPFGVMDYPDGNSAVSGTVDVSGWALDNKGVTKIEARVDEGKRVTLSYGSDRADVCAAWPGYPNCNKVGFSGKVSVSGLDKECSHLLEIIATDNDNNERIIDNRLINVK